MFNGLKLVYIVKGAKLWPFRLGLWDASNNRGLGSVVDSAANLRLTSRMPSIPRTKERTVFRGFLVDDLVSYAHGSNLSKTTFQALIRGSGLISFHGLGFRTPFFTQNVVLVSPRDIAFERPISLARRKHAGSRG